MDGVHELDDAKAEIERLKADYQIKAELAENLKRAHDEQLARTRELSLKVERQIHELNVKAEEIALIRHMNEDTKCKLNETEGVVNHLSSANEKMRVDCNNKLKRLEEDNRELVKALDEASEKNIDQEQKISELKEEINSLKGIVSVSQKKCLEAAEKARNPKEPREDMLLSLEDEIKKVTDQLKWKKEQFKHLEDAHEKLRGQFHSSKKEWESEKSRLVDDLCSLQTNLDSQTRISGELQNRLKMCNQALAHEESRRKCLEVQLAESKTHIESVFSECEEAKLMIENLTVQRDKEIAALRNSLGTKGAFYKEMEYKVEKLELENRDLCASLKELQEAQIQEAGNYSANGKLKSKLKSLEQIHRGCSANLKAKEEEWALKLKKLSGNLNDHISELKTKERAMEELKLELDSCQSLIMQLKLHNEESSFMLLILKSECAEAISKLVTEKSDKDLRDKETQERISILLKQLEMKDTALVKSQMALEEESKKSASLLRRIEALDISDQQQILQEELERHKKMLEESSAHQVHLRDQALQMEKEFEENLREVCNALDAANLELAERISEGSEIEFELQVWKSTAERLKAELEENYGKRREIEASLLAQVEVEEALKREKDGLIHLLEEKDHRLSTSEQQIVLLNQELEKTRTKTRRIESHQESLEELERTSDHQRKEIARLEALHKANESSLIDAEKVFKFEKENLLRLVEEKGQKIVHLKNLVKTLEQKQAEVDSIHEACGQKIATAEALMAKEVQEKNLLIKELQNDVRSLKQQLELQEETLSRSRQNVEKINVSLREKQLEVEELTCQLETMAKDVQEKNLLIKELENDMGSLKQQAGLQEETLSRSRQNVEKINVSLREKQLEVEELTCQLETKLRASDVSIKELETEKRKLLDEVAKLSSERGNLLGFLWDLGDKIGKYSNEDMQLMKMLERIVQTCNTDCVDMDLEESDELSYSIKENVGAHSSPSSKRLVPVSYERSPFREIND